MKDILWGVLYFFAISFLVAAFRGCGDGAESIEITVPDPLNPKELVCDGVRYFRTTDTAGNPAWWNTESREKESNRTRAERLEFVYQEASQ